jgi:hypothetical protein
LETKPEQYKWVDVKEKLDAFAPDLTTHLRDEIDTLLGLQVYDSDQLRKVWKKTEDAAKGDIRLPNMFVSRPDMSPESSAKCYLGYDTTDGAGMCRQDFRKRPSQVPTISILPPLPSRFLVRKEV